MRTNEFEKILNEYDDSAKINFLKNSAEASELLNYQIKNLVMSLSDESKMQLLHDSELLKKINMSKYQIAELLKSLGDEHKKIILEDIQFITQELQLKNGDITNIVVSFDDEKTRLSMIDVHKLEEYQKKNIVATFSDELKTEIILDNRFNFQKNNLRELISKLGINSLCDFLENNREFIENQEIRIYEIIDSLDENAQLQFIANLEDIGLTADEKRQVLAVLKQSVKEKIDISKLKPEYKTAIQIKRREYGKDDDKVSVGKIIVDFNEDLEIYKGLDTLININAEQLSDEERAKLRQLCEICPNMEISSDLVIGSSTAEEYLEGEKWIESVIKQINPEWNDIQKIAFIDNAIGKKISYSPDFETEVSDEANARALWKIIAQGYGVCNGIAEVEKYMLSKVGIEAERISSGKHSFLKLVNLMLPNENGTMSIGDTIIDPTWNLTTHRFGFRPANFCKSYSEIRKNDIRADGTDALSHRSAELEKSSTIGLDDKSLRKVFASIGLANPDGTFIGKAFADRAKAIDDERLPAQVEIEKLFQLLAEYRPEFAMCQNSTMGVLQMCLLAQPGLRNNKFVINRVYEKSDASKSPLVYVHASLQDGQKLFYFADKQTGQFVELPQKEFEERFECYERDLEKSKGIRPWQSQGQQEKKTEDLNKSSGKISLEETGGR